MKALVHGGDIYSYLECYAGERPIDFSSNINPLGIPEAVKAAAAAAIDECANYPDPLCRQLRGSIGQAEEIPAEWIFCGNGAAEIIFRLALAIRPAKALILAPTFSEYEQSLKNTDTRIIFHNLREEDGFCVTESVLDVIAGVEAVYLCNPNNPTGAVVAPELLEKILEKCMKNDAFLIVDECFNDFLDRPGMYSLKNALARYPKLVILKALTKMYALAGIRLGYCITSNRELIKKLYRCGQPWNVSLIAQKCGAAAVEERLFARRAVELIKDQRIYLERNLELLGFTVYRGSANYILFRNNIIPQLKKALEEHNILIRACGNYRGLDSSYFRIAVRGEEDNKMLIDTLSKLIQIRR